MLRTQLNYLKPDRVKLCARHRPQERDGGREVSALDSRSEGPWFKPRWGLKFQGFRIRSFHSTLGR